VRENVCPLFSLVKRESRHQGAVGNRIGELHKPEKRNRARGVAPRAEPNKFLTRLFLTGVKGEFLRANHLSMQRAGNECFALDFAALAIRDRDTIDFERPPDGALVIGLGFDEIGQGAQFRALCEDQIALRQNHLVDRGCAELILFLLRIKRLLLQFARLAGGIRPGRGPG